MVVVGFNKDTPSKMQKRFVSPSEIFKLLLLGCQYPTQL